MNSIGDRLKIVMGELSGRKFATALGLGSTTVNQYLNGRMPPADFIVLVCERFPDVAPWWLMTGQGKEPEKTASPVVSRIDLMLEGMDEEAQRDVLKYTEEKKQLAEFLKGGAGVENTVKKSAPTRDLQKAAQVSADYFAKQIENFTPEEKNKIREVLEDQLKKTSKDEPVFDSGELRPTGTQ